jgi:DNA-binding transcriptional LysR family regulator
MMPAHLVKDDIANGRLQIIRPIESDGRIAKLAMGVIHRVDEWLGPAAQWMVNHLSTTLGR